MSIEGTIQIGFENGLSSWADEDGSGVAAVGVLVLFEIDLPNGMCSIDHPSGHRTKLARPAAEELLQSNHIGHNLRQMGESGIDNGLGNFRHRSRLGGIGATSFQALDLAKDCNDFRIHHAFAGAPTKHPKDDGHRFIDVLA